MSITVWNIQIKTTIKYYLLDPARYYLSLKQLPKASKTQINTIPTYTFLFLAIHTTGYAFRKTFCTTSLLCKAASKSIELLTVSCSVWGWKKAKKTHHRIFYNGWNLNPHFILFLKSIHNRILWLINILYSGKVSILNYLL